MPEDSKGIITCAYKLLEQKDGRICDYLESSCDLGPGGGGAQRLVFFARSTGNTFYFTVRIAGTVLIDVFTSHIQSYMPTPHCHTLIILGSFRGIDITFVFTCIFFGVS